MKGIVIDGVGLKLTTEDNVATALDDLEAGRSIDAEGLDIELLEDISFGHKFALEALAEGDEVYKYGEVIARTTKPVEPGAWVHTHNAESTRGRGDLAGVEQ
ncbi:UxaA family hydrolase [Halorubrum halophilum]|uniref:UxaA family hydrolase n=1 Tax=Halorubrum halophilum TaxID=413816 RepID=UPI000678C638|nr:UxaA family hydrolase [Halorubrum halophilum]